MEGVTAASGHSKVGFNLVVVAFKQGPCQVNLMHRLSFAIAIVFCLSMFGCNFSSESTFELAPYSRLPKWFTPPSGLSRSDLTVTMSYYISPSGRTAIFTLLDDKKRKIAEVKGVVQGIEPIRLKDQDSPLVPDYPLYEIVTVNGITEIIEHRKLEPVFYITDDPYVLVEIGRLMNEKK